MKSGKVTYLRAHEILDSRGRPTVLVELGLDDETPSMASVPSGASTGRGEAVELRDADPDRYRGWGCRKAVENVNKEIKTAILGQRFRSQKELDRTLIELDGTRDLARLGSNAVLATSIAFAKAQAECSNIPLYQHFASLTGSQLHQLPRPMINLFSGGKHAGGQIAIQDLLIIVKSAETIDAALACTFEVYQAAAELTLERYGSRLLTADEGGLAPPFASSEAMLQDAIESVEKSGMVPGKDIVFALDIASSHFFSEKGYSIDDSILSSSEMIDVLKGWVQCYPIVSIEDGLAEDDWEHWPILVKTLGEKVELIGDDLLCTHPARIERAINSKAATALLLKVNQVGTLSEAVRAHLMAREAGWRIVASARSGETEDDWLADLALGWQAESIKVGSIQQSERLAKYNRLLLLEEKTGFGLHKP